MTNADIVGKIHSIETMGTLDGPGVRTVVFFQGCQLHCKFCHNADTIPMTGGTSYTISSLAKQLLRNREYWGEEGGVTLSGGEPLLQLQYVSVLIDELKGKDVNVAVDTNLVNGSLQNIRQLVNKVDLWMISVKSLDQAKHVQLTGMENTTILHNIRDLDDILTSRSIRIRYVVIPGLTDSHKDLVALSDFVRTIKHLEKLELLPYVSFGRKKWIDLVGRYDLDGVPDATRADLDHARNYFEATGVEVYY